MPGLNPNACGMVFGAGCRRGLACSPRPARSVRLTTSLNGSPSSRARRFKSPAKSSSMVSVVRMECILYADRIDVKTSHLQAGIWRRATRSRRPSNPPQARWPTQAHIDSDWIGTDLLKGFDPDFAGAPSALRSRLKDRSRKETGMTRPFEGIRVIDVTHVLAGPFAAYQLAVLGADVIKVEHPDDPDQSRGAGTDKELNKRNTGNAFLTQASNKRSITLDLKQASDREILKKLVATADVFVENYRPGAFAALGLGYEGLAATNPKLIYPSVSPFR